ncbi:MAG: chemotaxis protein CheW [Rhodospirillales bacterium]|nr:chemotaxis protein CheW [Rhodospirillales bacterium]
MDDLIVEFLTETNESLDELDLDIVNLEQNPNDKDLLSKIFRLMHTIKGTCGFLGLPRLEKCAHHAENVLGRFRDGDLEVTPDYVTLILESIDRIKLIVGGLGETGSEPEGDDSELIEKLDAVYEGRDGGGDAPAAEEAPPVEETSAPAEGGGCLTQEELDALEAAFQAADGPAEFALKEMPDQAATPAATPEPPKAEAAPKSAAPAPVASDPPAKAAAVSTQTLRVNVDVLENLMTMVSEMVLTRNQLIQILRQNSDSEFSAPLQRLNHVVSDLQEGVMKTRMQPIGNAWSKLPRIIRDLAIELNKKIELEMRGQDTELDRQVLELIKDPLTHMVRNSGDHGIEDPATRKAAGKPETGTILLHAFHEGGHIIIQISDDGKGLPLDKIKAKALANGLATAEELEEMSANQINQFIFNAGFSTAEKVTSVSGRGVGMDVVRTNIEKIGGSIELKSTEGKGSTFTIKIPLTLAIVSALIVESAKERFAIPQLAVRELVMASEDGDNRIETIKGTPVFRLRDRLLPLISLSDLLKLASPASAQKTAITPKHGDEDASVDADAAVKAVHEPVAERRHQYIVVTQVGNHDFGIIVDRVFDTEEIVVKPVAKILRDIELFSGNTILGDGSVIMILDPNGIAKNIGQIDAADSMAAMETESAYERQGEKTTLLLFAAGNKTPKAVPLSLVARLENIDVGTIERSGGRSMIQYRGKLMPLMPFDPRVEIGESGEKPVLVFTDGGRSMGIVVDEIIDIKEEYIDMQIDGGQGGLMGSAIIDGKATDIVDVGHFLQSNGNNWFKDHDDTPFSNAADASKKKTNGHAKKRVLLVDDSPFFRNMLTPLLSVAGYDVVSLESPHAALDMCNKGAEFDVIISDIEMPDMDGFEFAEKVKTETSWKETPMLALTSHATQKDIDRGMSVGFSKYIAKFDRDTLLNTISQTLVEQQQNSDPSVSQGEVA